MDSNFMASYILEVYLKAKTLFYELTKDRILELKNLHHIFSFYCNLQTGGRLDVIFYKRVTHILTDNFCVSFLAKCIITRTHFLCLNENVGFPTSSALVMLKLYLRLYM